MLFVSWFVHVGDFFCFLRVICRFCACISIFLFPLFVSACVCMVFVISGVSMFLAFHVSASCVCMLFATGPSPLLRMLLYLGSTRIAPEDGNAAQGQDSPTIFGSPLLDGSVMF